MQKNILKPVLTIVVIFILVGVFVFLTKTKSNVKEEIVQNISSDLESNINTFMESMVTEDDLGKDNYYCSNSIFGKDDKYAYAHVLCMGYEFNAKGDLEPVSGSSLPIRFEYTTPGFEIIGYTTAPDGENNDSKWKEIFPGEYYDKAIESLSKAESELMEEKLRIKAESNKIISQLPTETPILEKEIQSQPAYLINAYSKDGKNYIDVDYVEWLGGDASLSAQVEDGKCPNTTDCYAFPNGYKRNKNPQIRTFEVSSMASIEVNGTIRQELNLTSENPNISFESFANRVSTGESYYDYNKEGGFKQPRTFITIEVENNLVTSIVEPYQE